MPKGQFRLRACSLLHAIPWKAAAAPGQAVMQESACGRLGLLARCISTSKPIKMLGLGCTLNP